MLICQAAEIKEGVFGQEEFSFDGKIKDYTFKQFDVKEFTKTRTITIPEQPKTLLQESVEEIRDWQKENKWDNESKHSNWFVELIKYLWDEGIIAPIPLMYYSGIIGLTIFMIIEIWN